MIECGNALLQKGYKLKIFNTINFSKSMKYNPMAYMASLIRSVHPFCAA